MQRQIELPAAQRPSLAHTITKQLALTSLLAIVLQVSLVGTQYYLDREGFTTDFISRETDTISRGLGQGPSKREFKLPPAAAHYARRKADYAFRIIGADGKVLADNGSPWFLSGAPNAGWNNDQLRELMRIKGSDFEAVDVSSLQVGPDSGQARQPQAPSPDARPQTSPPAGRTTR